MRGNMIISINPWYYCNFKCDFCYLTKEQLAEWAQREAEYYADAEKWKRVQERMKREQAELEAEWKERDIFNQNK